MTILEKIQELKQKFSKTEYCVVCRKDTSIPVDMHVDLRYHYVEGAGQLCKKCYEEVYSK